VHCKSVNRVIKKLSPVPPQISSVRGMMPDVQIELLNLLSLSSSGLKGQFRKNAGLGALDEP
jgi:hypothetical protein